MRHVYTRRSHTFAYMSTFERVIITCQAAMSTYEGVVSTFEGVMSTYEGVVSTFEGVMSTYEGVVSAFEGVTKGVTDTHTPIYKKVNERARE